MTESLRVQKLRAKLKAREGKPGYEKNCEALRAEIARLTTIPSDEQSSAVASETDKDQSGE